MATTKPIANQFALTTPGKTLVEGDYMRNAILYMNSSSSTYGIVAAGTTQATATPLGAVLNQVDTVTSGTGVNLPLSTGKHGTPCQWVVVINNTLLNLSVYGFQGSSDTINGTAGSTAQIVAPGVAALFNTAKGGAWFSADIESSSSRGTFVATGSAVTVANTTITANSVVTFGLKTVGGTISAAPFMLTVTPGTGFTVNAGASDTSTYNYLIIG